MILQAPFLFVTPQGTILAYADATNLYCRNREPFGFSYVDLVERCVPRLLLI